MGIAIPQVITEDRASGAQVIDGSLKFDSSQSHYLSKTFASAGNRKTWTWSAWIKTNNATGDQGLFGNTTSDVTFIRFKSGQMDFVVNGLTHRRTNAYYRDPATFYHFVWAVDSTISSPAANRSRFYVNGVEVDSWGTNNALTENGDLGINSTNAHIIGATDLVPNDLFYGSMQNIHFIDGQQLDPSYFGYTDPLTNTWRPKKYAGTYGTNGFYLPMDNESDFEIDKSGRGNNWTKNNFSGTSNDPDVLPDSPSGISYSTDSSSGITTTSQIKPTNWCTLNPLQNIANDTFSDGNLKVVTSSSNYGTFTSTMVTPASGKWYAEVSVISQSGFCMLGLCSPYGSFTATKEIYDHDSVTYYAYDGSRWIDGSTAAYGATYTGGDLIGIAYDADGGTVTFYKNGVSQGVITSVPIREYCFAGSDLNGGASDTHVWNFGQKPFKFPPPDGFQPLNAANVRPETVIVRPDQYVGITTYTGTNASVQKISTEFEADLVWFKSRSDAYNNALFDTVRGATKKLISNATNAEQTDSEGVKTFFDNGVTVGNSGEFGASPRTYVMWHWKAGGSKNTFNVDDVGYESASDVGMNVGGQNSNAYNTSAIWSDMMSGPSNSGVYTSLFDGTDGPSGGYEVASDGNTLTFTPTGGITANSSIEIYVSQSSGTYAGSADITVNGTSIKTGAVQSTLGTGAASGYVNIGTTSLTTLTWSNPAGSNNDYRLMAIRVDGKILLDSDQTAPNVPTIAATGCSVGTKQGFSIIKYTGTGTAGSIAHGLSEQPKFVIIKDLKNANAWAIQHVGATLGRGLLKFSTAASDTSVATAVWNSTSPSSFVFNVGTSGDTNYTTNSAEYIAYLWHDVPGLQKFGSYTGNGSADGPVIITGFRPKLILIKRYDSGSTASWHLYDSERAQYNVITTTLAANESSGEGSFTSGYDLDFLSNGVKIRAATSNAINTNGGTYIYAAWAEAPSFNLYGAQANAR